MICKKPLLIKLVWLAISLLFLASVIPNLFPNYWLIDIFSNFKVQYIFFGILLLIISWFVVTRRSFALILLGFTLIWNAYYIVPLYLNATDKLAQISETIKISSINLLSSNTQKDLVKNFIEEENPDILILMEYTPQWEDRLTPIFKNYRFIKTVPRVDNFGIALFSKIEMRCNTEYFNLDSKPSLVADLLINDKPFTVVATHPVPPIGQANFENRNKQLNNLVKASAGYAKNLAILGDFNTSSFSNHFRKLTNVGLKDSRTGFGILPTWPADFSILQTTLDHCLVSKNLQILDRKVGTNIGSDHLPITVIIGLR